MTLILECDNFITQCLYVVPSMFLALQSTPNAVIGVRDKPMKMAKKS